MALKSVIVFSLLLACIAMPLAEAQLGGLGGLGGLVGSLFGIFRIQGIIYCTPNGNIGVNGTSTPVFPNALVQLQCGGNVVSTATTNGSGVFSILLDPLNFLLPTLISGCRVVVSTPLVSCNANLPSVGGLISNLQFIGSTITGPLNIANIIPIGFQFNANMN
ncbi:pollen Ole e 1 allergen and extensin family protein [Striga asiatica]|uniref:Pollen Ole e 1 allergen and extensin family protein n=1 Tax=Striga asiatica TaxID=4170 RepID=A0A5A7PL48_STRAF|nr:pollen Ole e 1 allergen and extensin family protein [Striga asiatica]